jgi:transcriptional regulator with XRE-family HTH domain
MTIGETLAEARRSAGLTITQVSERTRVRETIIRGIEQDDYGACGGDFYARGHIRSIARAVGADPVPLIAEYDATVRAPEEITAAEALEPTMAIRAVERRPANWTAILAVAALAAFGFLGYHLASSGGHATASPAAVTQPAHHAARHSGHAAAHHAAHPKPASSPTVQLTSLSPVSVTAFGPDGPGQGDNPGQASLAVSGNPATPWNTDWYATADFGNMQSGTGLLLDMGKPVTVTSVEITLGSTPGADLQLRTGDAPQLADLKPVATATNAGGVLHLQLASPAQGRYLLIWFTKLPPNSSGTFEAFVSGVSLKGQS